MGKGWGEFVDNFVNHIIYHLDLPYYKLPYCLNTSSGGGGVGGEFVDNVVSHIYQLDLPYYKLPYFLLCAQMYHIIPVESVRTLQLRYFPCCLLIRPRREELDSGVFLCTD